MNVGRVFHILLFAVALRFTSVCFFFECSPNEREKKILSALIFLKLFFIRVFVLAKKRHRNFYSRLGRRKYSYSSFFEDNNGKCEQALCYFGKHFKLDAEPKFFYSKRFKKNRKLMEDLSSAFK